MSVARPGRNPVFFAEPLERRSLFAAAVGVGAALVAHSEAPATSAAAITAADDTRISAGGVTVESTPNFNGKVASFLSLDGLGAGNEAVFSASIDWGDGSAPTAGQIVYNPVFQQFDVIGQHTYAAPASYNVNVLISENIGNTSAQASSIIVVSAAPGGGQIGSIIDDILSPLINSKVLPGGQGKQIRTKLESAMNRLEAGDKAGAIGELKQLLKQLGGKAHARPELQTMIDAVNTVLAGLSAG